MPINLDRILLGEQYNRDELAGLLGYGSGFASISHRVVIPSGSDKIVLFVTGKKQKGHTQFNDYFVGDILHMEGETNHRSDKRLINAAANGDEIHLFFRDVFNQPYIYHGKVLVSSYEKREPESSLFVFETIKTESNTTNALLTEEVTHGITDQFTGDPEGAERVALHVTYERSPKNRAAAIRIHGTKCNCCRFDFNMAYGSELARDYIEIHHIKSITQTSGGVNPATDLVPLCSNCHSMVHRKSGEIMPVEQLREIMRANGWHLPTSD